MITLKSDNRGLVSNAKFAYLLNNNLKNVSSLEVSNTEPFSVGTPILIGEINNPNAAILKVKEIDGSNLVLGDKNNITTSTDYAYPESTRVVALQFDQIRFFWTLSTGTIADEKPVFDDNTPLTDWIDLDPSSFYSIYVDKEHSSGFGWFQYKNALTGETSLESNPIPYSGFNLNTVQQIFADFDNSLNTNELKLVSMKNKFAWLNESLAILETKLNLTNAEFSVSTPQEISLITGTAEYLLADDFSDMVEIVDDNQNPIENISVSKVLVNNKQALSVPRYYLRGRYIGFSPTPDTTGKKYSYTYRAKANRVSNLSSFIHLPDNAFYSLKDYMLYRACLKFKDPLATVYYQSFKNTIDLFMQSAVKRSANLDSWTIDPTSNT